MGLGVYGGDAVPPSCDGGGGGVHVCGAGSCVSVDEGSGGAWVRVKALATVEAGEEGSVARRNQWQNSEVLSNLTDLFQSSPDQAVDFAPYAWLQLTPMDRSNSRWPLALTCSGPLQTQNFGNMLLLWLTAHCKTLGALPAPAVLSATPLTTQHVTVNSSRGLWVEKNSP